MTQEYLENFAEKNGFIGVFRTSAKQDMNISQVFALLTREILIKEIQEQQEEEEEEGNGEGMPRGQSFNLNNPKMRR